VRFRFVPSVWQGAAALYGLALVLISLLPASQLEAYIPIARDSALDPGLRDLVIELSAIAGLLLLMAPVALRARKMRIRVAPRLWLSRPLSLAVVLCVACLALIASQDLREAATGLLPASLSLAVDRLSAGHVMAYGGLGLLLALGWGREMRPWRLGVLALALSGVLEVVQDLVPGRAANPWDLLSNGLGLAMGLTAGSLLIAEAPVHASAGGARHSRRGRRRHRPFAPAVALQRPTSLPPSGQRPAAARHARQHREPPSDRYVLRQPRLGRRRRDDDRD
jgi:VanZ family protein